MTKKKIKEKEGEVHVEFDNHDIALLRTKLKYLPVIMASGVYGPVDSASFRGQVLHRFFAGPWDMIWMEPEDSATYEHLMSRIRERLKVINARTYREVKYWEHLSEVHGAWPVTVLELPEVGVEIDFLLTKPFLTFEDSRDKEVEKSFGKWIAGLGPLDMKGGYSSYDEAINDVGRRLGRLFGNLRDLYKKYNVSFWFYFFNL